MENTIAYFGLKDEDDYMYKKGEEKTTVRLQKTFEQNQRFAVINLLDMAVLTDAQIINALDVTPLFVQKVKKDLALASKKVAHLKKTQTAGQIAQTLQLPINWVEKQLRFEWSA